jgi:multidrug efflux system membrane fusion protein
MPPAGRTKYRVSIFSKSRSVIFGLCVVLAAGCGRGAKPADEKAPPATVKWEGPLQSALEEWTELVGTTVPLPDRVARVSAPIEGRVLSVFGDASSSPVAEGQRVEKGAVLVQLDPTVVQANLAKAEATQEVLKEEERQATYAVALAQSEVDRLSKLKAEEDKQPGGSRTTLVSPVDRLKADYALRDAQSKLKAAAGRLTAGLREQDALRAQLKLHTLAAPVGGRVGRIQVVRGQTLAVGTPVAEILDLDEQIDVLCFVPPSLVGRLRLGQPARTGGFDATSAEPEAEGQLEFIADQAEPETGNVAVKVRFSNKDSHLRANRVMRIRVLTKPGKECLSVRETGVQEDEERPTVVIVTDIKTVKGDDGKEDTVGVARRLNAVLGVRDRTLHQIEIVRLEDPEKDPAKKWQGELKDVQVVVEGAAGLQTGDAVKLEVEGD